MPRKWSIVRRLRDYAGRSTTSSPLLGLAVVIELEVLPRKWLTLERNGEPH